MTPPISKGLCPWNCIMTSDVNCLLWGQSACYRRIPPEGQHFTALIFACCLPLLAFAHTVKWPTKWDALKHIFRCCNYALRRNWLESTKVLKAITIEIHAAFHYIHFFVFRGNQYTANSAMFISTNIMPWLLALCGSASPSYVHAWEGCGPQRDG